MKNIWSSISRPGFAFYFISFDEVNSAKDAITGYHGKIVNGFKLRVQFAKQRGAVSKESHDSQSEMCSPRVKEPPYVINSEFCCSHSADRKAGFAEWCKLREQRNTGDSSSNQFQEKRRKW